MFDTERVYVTRVEAHALNTIYYYDITEYESHELCKKKNRTSKSPMYILNYLDKSVVTSEKVVKCLEEGLLREWMKKKLVLNLPFLILWFTYRAAIFMSFYIIITTNLGQSLINMTAYVTYLTNIIPFKVNITALSEGNTTMRKMITKTIVVSDIVNASKYFGLEKFCKHDTDWYGVAEIAFGLSISLVVFAALLTIVFDFVDILYGFLRSEPFSKWHGRQKNTMITTKFYRISHHLFVVSALSWAIGSLIVPHEISIEFVMMLTCFLSVWSILYFIQLIPSLGEFVNSIQRMLYIMSHFIIVYVIIMFPYPHAFNMLLKDEDGCNAKGFETIFDGFYTTFKMMLNMVNLGDYTSSIAIGVAEILHVIFVFVVAILLVNFLIALLSTGVGGEVSTQKVIFIALKV